MGLLLLVKTHLDAAISQTASLTRCAARSYFPNNHLGLGVEGTPRL
jgi:hypothetical protein